MKKIICISMLIAFAAVLCSCGKNTTSFKIQPFSCEIIVSCANEKTEAVFTYENEKNMYLDFSDIEHIGGIRVKYCDGVYDYICDGISVEHRPRITNVPLFEVFEAIELLSECREGVSCGRKGVFSLSGDNREYIYTVDKVNGRILKIQSDSSEIIFRN